MDFLEILTHHVYDAFYILRWICENLVLAITTIFRPLTWLLSFIKGFWASATSPPLTSEIILETSANVKVIFEAIPYWSQIMLALGMILSILILVFIFRKLANI